MKVILLQDVARIGKRHAEVVVPDGYALNQLIPKQMAIPATVQNRQRLAQTMANKAASHQAAAADFAVVAARLATTPIEIVVTANEQGHLFQAIHQSDVVTGAAAQGVTIPADWVVLPADPIKSVGTHEIALALGTVSKPCTIIVVAK